ncbi:hypothetical protein [Bergeriella denitrificans]|nr:hypothetical protein [Bergeriella denitrificans]
MIETPAMPPLPAALLVPPLRPAPPASGTPQALLEHAAEFGRYVGALEQQNAAWRTWAGGIK